MPLTPQQVEQIFRAVFGKLPNIQEPASSDFDRLIPLDYDFDLRPLMEGLDMEVVQDRPWFFRIEISVTLSDWDEKKLTYVCRKFARQIGRHVAHNSRLFAHYQFYCDAKEPPEMLLCLGCMVVREPTP